MENELTQAITPPDYKAEIAGIIKSNLTPKHLKARLADYHSADIAAAMAELQPDERAKLYRMLDLDTLADVLEYTDDIAPYLCELGIGKQAEILSRIQITTAASYLEGLSKQARSATIALMRQEPREELSLLLSFDKDEIGSKMSTNYISISSDLGVRGAMHELIAQAAENDNVSTIYVTDEGGAFAGAIDLKDLIVARSETPLDAIIMTSYPYVYASEMISECIERIKSYSEDSIPVLDADNKLVGVLTAQDLGQLVEDEIGDDYAKLGGLAAEESLKEPLKKSIGKRLPWLCILFGMGLLVSGVVGVFESVVAHLTMIVSFQSLILGMAGNVGTQSLAVTIRLLVDEDLGKRKKLFLIFKEARIGLCNGLLLGLLSFILVGLYLLVLKNEPAGVAFSISLCTGVALLVSMLLSAISGTSIPILLQKCKIDPAVASGPFITTINDLVAVVTYYGLSWLLLIRILQL